MRRLVLTTTTAAFCFGILALVAPHSADACGGTFCDAVPGPQSMPVDQTGENILFYQDGDFIEAHIQIQYEGDPERFAWVIPVTAAPTEIKPGSNALIQNALAGTVPTFVLDAIVDACADDGGVGFGCAASDASAGVFEGTSLGDGDGDGDGDESGGTNVLERGVAGAFEFVVLESDDVGELVQWLEDNDYEQDDEAPPILEEYIEEGFVFVAIKLSAGVGVEEIHPLVVRYQGDEPCIPIRLTRIAAKPDMAIRAFFLGETRWAPKNYEVATINYARIDWLGQPLAGNYLDVVSQAIDEAGGHAFVTEYAGTAAAVPQSGIFSPSWDPDAFLDKEIIYVIDELESQGLWDCDFFDEFEGERQCVGLHPLIEPMVAEYLPVPDGLDPNEFYDCLECFEEDIDVDAWIPQAFADDMAERIVGPADHALAILDDSPYLTRLFTLLSPEEMTVDPMFHANTSLPDVSAQIEAERHFACDGPDYLRLPNDVDIVLDDSSNYDIDMPALATVGMAPASGPIQIETDNQEEIEAAIEDWNEPRRSGPELGCKLGRRHLDLEGLLGIGLLFGIAAGARRRRRS